MAALTLRILVIQTPASVLFLIYAIFFKGQDKRSLINTRIHFSYMIGNNFSVNKTEIIIAVRFFLDSNISFEIKSRAA